MDTEESYPKMDRGAKKRWVKALRSGKYKQAKDGLVKRVFSGEDGDIGYCCLGVYCEISTRAKRDGVYYGWIGDNRKFVALSSTSLPRPLREAIKLDLRAQDHLMTMNDSHDKSFEEIADWIEANL